MDCVNEDKRERKKHFKSQPACTNFLMLVKTFKKFLKYFNYFSIYLMDLNVLKDIIFSV